MKSFRVFALVAIVLSTSACASRPLKSDAAPIAVAAPEQTAVNDPWEGYNRRVYGFNNTVDKVVMRPVAVAYDWITPDPVQASVTRFFGNLREPATAVNQALQMRPVKAVQTLGRFVVNTTVGVAGLFDPATRFGMAKEQEDFGQTLATWGWRDSRYFVMPLLGPRTVRDTVGMFGDQPLSPIGRVDNTVLANSLTLLQMADGRASMLQVDGMREFALDEYVMVRDMWMQKRSFQIEKDL
jgi:phospholipid-binding lipoprotein MlaA